MYICEACTGLYRPVQACTRHPWFADVGQDLTGYFPPPLVLACPDLVTESALELTYKNFTPVVPLTMHRFSSLQSVQNTALDSANWYTATFQQKMKNYHKGPLVRKTKNIVVQAGTR